MCIVLFHICMVVCSFVDDVIWVLCLPLLTCCHVGTEDFVASYPLGPMCGYESMAVVLGHVVQ